MRTAGDLQDSSGLHGGKRAREPQHKTRERITTEDKFHGTNFTTSVFISGFSWCHGCFSLCNIERNAFCDVFSGWDRSSCVERMARSTITAVIRFISATETMSRKEKKMSASSRRSQISVR